MATFLDFHSPMGTHVDCIHIIQAEIIANPLYFQTDITLPTPTACIPAIAAMAIAFAYLWLINYISIISKIVIPAQAGIQK